MQTKVSSKVKERQKRKFEALLVKQTSRADIRDCQVVNLSSKQLAVTSTSSPVQGTELCPEQSPKGSHCS